MKEQTATAIESLEEEYREIQNTDYYNGVGRMIAIDAEIERLKEGPSIIIKEKQLQIIKYYGEDHQLDKLIEESAELVQAICKWRHNYFSENSIDYLENMLEEMADVTNLIEQFSLSDKSLAEKIQEYKIEKVDRELRRMTTSLEG